MKKTVILAMTGAGFTFGLFMGLMLQLPGVSIPREAGIQSRVPRADLNPGARAQRLGLDRQGERAGRVFYINNRTENPDKRFDSGITPSDALHSEISSKVKGNENTDGYQKHNPKSTYLEITQQPREGALDSRPELNNHSFINLHETRQNREIYEPPLNRDSSQRDNGVERLSSPTPREINKNEAQTSVIINVGGEGTGDVVPVVLDKLQVSRQQMKGPWAKGSTTPHNDNYKVERRSSRSSNRNRTSSDSLLAGIVNGIYWSRNLEKYLPKGFTKKHKNEWTNVIATQAVASLREGCGRMQNRIMTFSDSRRACARYRINTDQIQGEIFSYYLAQILGIRNVPPSTLGLANPTTLQWSNVHQELGSAQWSHEKPFVMVEWVDGLSPTYIPESLRNDTRKLHPTEDILLGKSINELVELMQWSDLIVFDYLTANVDRVVNNMFNLQWNSQMMASPTHNLERTQGGLLVFLDNESGLFHSYRLLDKYSSYHDSLLKSLCVFRPSTFHSIMRLYKRKESGERLWRMFVKHEQLHHWIPRLPESNEKVLQERIDAVYQQMTRCRHTYGGKL